MRFMDLERFSVSQAVQALDVEECATACKGNAGGLCGAGHLKFRVKRCSIRGDCISEEQCTTEAMQDKYPMHHPECVFLVTPQAWKPFAVISTLIIGVVLIVDGVPAEVVLVGAS